jgi:hypothetical protein
MYSGRPAKRFVSLTLVGFLVLIAGSSAASDLIAARVQTLEGTVTILRHGRVIPLKAGDEVLASDTIQTGRDGSVGVVFTDDTVLSLGPVSILAVDEFVFAPRQARFRIVLRMIKGTATYLSGLISRFSPESARFETPSASIGIRGTRFVVRVEAQKAR